MVIDNISKRRRRSNRSWTILMKKFSVGNFKVVEFCKQHDVSISNFYKWQRRFSLGVRGLSQRAKRPFIPIEVLRCQIRSF